jgi:hypothetical protein
MKMRKFLISLLSLSIVFSMSSLNVFAAGPMSNQTQDKGIVVELADGNTVELKDGESIVYQLKKDNSSKISTMATVGTVVMTPHKISSNVYEFDVKISVSGTKITYADATVDYGDGTYGWTSVHPAGISNKAYLNYRNLYIYKGTYKPNVSEVNVTCLNGDVLHLLGSMNIKTIKITKDA